MKNTSVLFLITLMVFYLVDVKAQAPQSLNYQGVARTSSGAVLSSLAIGLEFTILSGSTNGTTVYQETQKDTTNQFGLFSVAIGEGTVISGNFSTIDWGANREYLEVGMDPTGGTNYTDMGTQQLLSVPYALYSASTGDDTTMWKKIGNDIYYNAGKVGIDTTPGGYELTVKGVVEINGSATTGIVLTPNANATKSGTLFQTSDQLVFGASGVANIFGIDLNAPACLSILPTGVLQSNSDVYLSSNTNGVILSSPNGGCWRLTVDNSGTLVVTSITCP